MSGGGEFACCCGRRTGAGGDRGDLARKKLTDAHTSPAARRTDIPALLTSMDAAVAPYPDAQRFYFRR